VLKHVTPTVARDLLRRHRLSAGRRHGQHFLVDPNTVRRIVRLADIQADETILEIGPGLGSLTVALAEAAKRVVAVEVDSDVAEALRESAHDDPAVDIVVADALHADLSALVGGPARLVANLPYNVATPLFIRVLDEVPEIAGGLVMVQRELGERWTAVPGTHAYNALSVHVTFLADARIAGDVPATVFLPRPKVSSVLVSFERRASPPVEVDDARSYFAFTRKVFGHRRKTVRNSLVSGGFEKDAVERALRTAGIVDRARPEDLDLQALARLHRELS
jgi:16S rRNA (adenine1518-N6/adenine1519-N6)-dimethyltransferase